MSTPALTRAPVKDFLAQLADDALAWRDRKSGDHCGDCARLAAQRCADCARDEETAARYKALAWAVDGAGGDEDAMTVFGFAATSLASPHEGAVALRPVREAAALVRGQTGETR